MSARNHALQALSEILADGAYSNRAISRQIAAGSLTAQDKKFMTEIVYGTLQHYRLLDHWAQPFFKGRVKQWVRILVLMTLYQIKFLDGVPTHAAVHEAVNIAKRRGGEFNAKLVNGILRELGRAQLEEPEGLALKTSHPEWLLKLWAHQFGEEKAEAMARANNERPALALRVNPLKGSREELAALLKEEGVFTTPGALSDDALLVSSGSPLQGKAFEEGWFYIQDETSMLAARALGPQPEEMVLDACAAPGGKTTHLASLMEQTGKVVAHDVYDHKIALIEENAKRLGILNIDASIQDAAKLSDVYPAGSFDKVLVDAPCSALGILRRHPEAKLTKQPEDLDKVIRTQKDILASAARLVKPGGRLVYSTCTVNRKENDRMVAGFLNEFPEFALDESLAQRMPLPLQEEAASGMVQLYPGVFGTDGFFIASLTRRE